MSKSENSRQPTTTKEGREVSLTDIIVCTPKEKNVGTIVGTQSIAGTEVRIVEYQGKLYIPEIDVADGLDQDHDSFRQLLKRNSALLDDYPRNVRNSLGVKGHDGIYSRSTRNP
jgi:hypothetical protein